MLYLSDSDKELFITIKRLLLESKVRLAITSNVATSREVCRDKIRMAAKNVAIQSLFEKGGQKQSKMWHEKSGKKINRLHS